jgi:hypothetical protein
MDKAVLVTEGQTPLGAALVRLLLERGFRVAAAIDPPAEGGGTPRSPGNGSRAFLSVPWNRRSPVAAHTLLMSIRSGLGSLDEALILEPLVPPSPLARSSSAEIEKPFDDLKGVAFLVRELLGHFSAGGVLSLVGASSRSADQPGQALEQAVHEGFRGLASSLLAPRDPGPLLVNGFQGGAAEPDEYAAFIDRTLEEKGRRMGGRWFTFPARGGILRGRFERS